MTQYSFTKVINPTQLELEILRSGLFTNRYDHIETSGETVYVIFTDALSSGEQSALATIVDSHIPTECEVHVEPVVVNINEVPTYAVEEFEMSYFKQTYEIDTTTSVGPYTKTITWPYTIAILGGRLPAKDPWIGDVFSVTIAPKTLVGQLTTAMLTGVNHFHMGLSAVTDYIWKGDKVHLFDGTNYHELGYVTSKYGDQVTMQSNAAADFPIGTGVAVSTEIIPEYRINGAEEIILGRKTHRGMRLPSPYPLVIEYTNNSQTAKKVVFSLEWYA